MTESALRTQAMKYLKSRRAFVCKLSDRYTSGLPDIMYLERGRLPVFIELKTSIGKLSEIQKWTSERLKESGCEFYVIRSMAELRKVI